MKRYIAILRGINVAGKRKVLMADLRALFIDLGYTKIETYIQSGNVAFNATKHLDEESLKNRIAEKIKDYYGFDIPIIIRSNIDLKAIIKDNPYLPNVSEDKLHLTFLSHLPKEENTAITETFNFSPDTFHITKKEVYIHVPEKYGLTKLSNSFFEKKLKVSVTTRNWKTVKKLYEMTLSN